MRIRRKNHQKKRTLIIIVGILLLATAGYLGYVYYSSHHAANDQSQATSKSEQGTEDAPPISSSNDDTTQDADEDVSETSKPVTTPKRNESTKGDKIATPTILSAKQTDSTHVRVSADFTETANGTCQLTLTKNGESPITKKAEIIVVPNGYACNGFMVTVPSNGGWTATVLHLYKGMKSEPATAKVE